MEATYKEQLIKPPSSKQLAATAFQLGYDLGKADVQQYKDIIANSLIKTYQRLAEIPDPKLPVKYRRTPGSRPASEDNPYNAWYWRCDIKGADVGKLHKRTIAIKDNVCVAGVPMMNGSQILQGYVPDVDATVVSRILDAGGHIIGKAVCENLCNSGASFTSATGPVVNPHDSTRIAGGSSSGCAALVAGGFVDMAIGGDQGGSIRNPCGSCGIVGLKPTFGLVPYTGICPVEFILDHVGPMGRNVRDVALLLEVIAGSDNGLDYRQPQGLQIPESYVDQLTGNISHLRLGLLKEGFSHSSSEPDVDELVKQAATQLTNKTGALLEEISVPMHLDAKVILTALCDYNCWPNRQFETIGYQVTSLHEMFTRGLKTRANDVSVNLKVSAVQGKYLQDNYHGVFYAKAHNLVLELRKVFDEALSKVDVLLMPTKPMKARSLPPANLTIKEYVAFSGEHNINTCTFNMTGHPALSINAGFSEGLPVGMMIVGRRMEDATVLNVAYTYEKIRDACFLLSNLVEGTA